MTTPKLPTKRTSSTVPTNHGADDRYVNDGSGSSDRSERLFHALTDNSWDRVAILDAKGIIRYSSPSSTRIYFYKTEELVGRNAFDFVHPEDVGRTSLLFRQLLPKRGATVQVQYRALRKDGQYIWMETTASSMLHDPDIRGVVINEREITATRQSQAELTLTKARLEYLLSATPTVIYAASQAAQPEIIYVSGNIYRQFGYRKEEIVGAANFWGEFLHPDDAAKVRGKLGALRIGQREALEYQLRHRDGTYRCVRTEVSVVAGKQKGTGEIVGYWLDVTDRKRVDAALLATLECGEALMRATSEPELLESICTSIVKMGGYRMAWVGFPDPESAKTILPAARAGAGKDYVDKARVTWASGEPRGHGPVGRAMRTRKPVVCRDLAHDPRFAPWRKEALRRGYASVIGLPLLWRSECLGTLAIYSDQTVAFHREEAMLLQTLAGDIAYGLIALRTRAERERLQHELLEISEREQRRIAQDLHDGLCQQLLGAGFLAGALERRMEQRDDPETQAVKRIAETVRNCAKDARSLSHGVHPVDAAPKSLMRALENFVDVTSRMFGIACRFVCQRPVLVRQQTTATHLYRIAQEAVGNAIKHGGCSRVTIRLRHVGLRELELAIRDNGVGIPAHRPKEKRKGGMGLQIMHHRASMCGGKLDIRRCAPTGTLVLCCVPTARRNRAPA